MQTRGFRRFLHLITNRDISTSELLRRLFMPRTPVLVPVRSTVLRARIVRRQLQSPSRCSERGAALVEFAILVPLFVILIFGLVDISLMVINYSKLEQAVREGVRTASRTAIITEGDFANLDTNENRAICESSGSGDGLDCGHLVVQARIRRIMFLQGMADLGVPFYNPIDFPDEHGPTILTRWTHPQSVADVDNRDTFFIAVQADFFGFFGIMEYPMRVEFRGPWLYEGPPSDPPEIS